MVSRASELELGGRRDFDSHPDSEFFLSLLVLEISSFHNINSKLAVRFYFSLSPREDSYFKSEQLANHIQSCGWHSFKEDEYVPPGRIKEKLYSIA